MRRLRGGSVAPFARPRLAAAGPPLAVRGSRGGAGGPFALRRRGTAPVGPLGSTRFREERLPERAGAVHAAAQGAFAVALLGRCGGGQWSRRRDRGSVCLGSGGANSPRALWARGAALARPPGGCGTGDLPGQARWGG